MFGGHFGYAWRPRASKGINPGAAVDEWRYPCEPYLPATHVVRRKLVQGPNSNAARDRACNKAK